MIVRLTHTQGRVVMDRVPELYRIPMELGRTPYGRTQHSYELPAIAWRQILDRLYPQAFGPLGGLSQDAPKSLLTAIGHIQEMVSILESHPAILGLSAWGAHTVVIPAWKFGQMQEVYPIMDAEFGMFNPRVQTSYGHEYTEWVFEPGDGDTSISYTFAEDAHLAFVGRS